MLKLRNEKKLKIKESAGMLELTLFNQKDQVENHIMVSGDYIAGMVFETPDMLKLPVPESGDYIAGMVFDLKKVNA